MPTNKKAVMTYLNDLDLTRFRGHPDDWIGGVHDVEQSGAVRAGI